MARYSRANTVIGIHTSGVEFIGMFWSQVETDTVPPFSRVYDGLIDTLAITVREIAEHMNMLFVTFQMLPLWVGTYSELVAVQNALRDVATLIPYAASTAILLRRLEHC